MIWFLYNFTKTCNFNSKDNIQKLKISIISISMEIKKGSKCCYYFQCISLLSLPFVFTVSARNKTIEGCFTNNWRNIKNHAISSGLDRAPKSFFIQPIRSYDYIISIMVSVRFSLKRSRSKYIKIFYFLDNLDLSNLPFNLSVYAARP